MGKEHNLQIYLLEVSPVSFLEGSFLDNIFLWVLWYASDYFTSTKFLDLVFPYIHHVSPHKIREPAVVWPLLKKHLPNNLMGLSISCKIHDLSYNWDYPKTIGGCLWIFVLNPIKLMHSKKFTVEFIYFKNHPPQQNNLLTPSKGVTSKKSSLVRIVWFGLHPQNQRMSPQKGPFPKWIIFQPLTFRDMRVFRECVHFDIPDLCKEDEPSWAKGGRREGKKTSFPPYRCFSKNGWLITCQSKFERIAMQEMETWLDSFLRDILNSF